MAADERQFAAVNGDCTARKVLMSRRDETTALLAAFAVHLCWIMSYGWYLKLPDRFWCSNDPSPSLMLQVAPSCPTARPLSTVVLLATPIVGIVLGIWIPLLVVREDPLYATNQWAKLGCAIPLVVIAAIIWYSMP
jgi:hypothetical protein